MMAPESLPAILACVDLWPFMTILLLDCLNWPSRSSRVPKRDRVRGPHVGASKLQGPPQICPAVQGAHDTPPSLHILAPASQKCRSFEGTKQLLRQGHNIGLRTIISPSASALRVRA